MIKPIALGLAVGIAFDAFLVRMTLVPAIMTLLGKAAWWMPKWLGKLLPNVDIEGEQLREHREATLWSQGETEFAVSADSLVVGSDETAVGPLDLAVPSGAIAIASGETTDRRLFAAALAGRLHARSGRAQVLGHPLPSEAATVTRLVALADVGGVRRTETTVTLGELFQERLEMTQPWFRMWSTRGDAERWIERVNSATATAAGRRTVPVTTASTLETIPQLERAVALAAIAIAERTPIVMLDQLDAFASDDDERAFVRAVVALAPPSTTVFFGTPIPLRAVPVPDVSERPIVMIDLYATSMKGSLL